MHIRKHSVARIAALFLTLGLMATAATPASAQQRLPNDRNSIPSAEYWAAHNLLDEGELQDGLEMAIKGVDRGALKGANGRWVDSICHHAAAGEGYYRLGNFIKAREHYKLALQQFLQYPQWTLRVDWPVQVPIRQQPLNIPWGKTSRQNVQVADFGDTLPFNSGGVFPFPGGAFTNLKKIPVNVMEIMRATAVSMQRYRELTGPACAHDPIVGKLETALRAAFPANHWSERFGDILLGLVRRMDDADGEAFALLERGRLLEGAYDHPLTAIAFDEMGDILQARGDYQDAAASYAEATYAQCYAMYPAGPTLLENAFHKAYVCTQLTDRQARFAPMAEAARWAQRYDLLHLRTRLLLDMAEESFLDRKTREGKQLLVQINRGRGRSDLLSGLLGARYHHMDAIAKYQDGNIKAGDDSLSNAIKMTQSGASRWGLHLKLIDEAVRGGLVAELAGMRLYEQLLRDPTRADWGFDPLDTLTLLKTPHADVYENWFELALKRGDTDKAIVIADLTRRHRFFSALPLGGRLMGLRWLLAGPAERLTNDEVLMRRDLLAQYPAYADLSTKAAGLHDQAKQFPWATAGQQELRRLESLLGQLDEVTQAQEAQLREMAARREMATFSFPPIRRTADIRASLPEGHLALVFFKTSRDMHVFQIGKINGRDYYDTWRIPAVERTFAPATALLRDMGNFNGNRPIRSDDLEETSWRESGLKLLGDIYGGQPTTIPEGVEELIVVPDGYFWFIPFEALQVKAGAQTESLISRMRVRYAPTVGLMLPMAGRETPLTQTTVAVGKLMQGEPAEVLDTAVQDMREKIAGTVVFPARMVSTRGAYESLFERLVVLDDIEDSASQPFAWSPLPGEKGRESGTLASWFSLPFAAPREVILPGYHTSAEDAMASQDALASGNEMFLSVMGMMSSGTRTIMLSRWRLGGQTCYDLVREYVKELAAGTKPAEAWQRCVFLAVQTPLDPAKEPRLNLARNNGGQFNASHPFFWAGYMVIDTGVLPPLENNAEGVIGNGDGDGG